MVVVAAEPRLPPGPQLSRARQAVEWYRSPIELLERCATEYGDVFTLRLPQPMGDTVMVSHPDDLKAVFTDQAETLAGVGNIQLEPLIGSSSLLMLDGPEHTELRRLMLPPFHGKLMLRYGERIAEIVTRRVEEWPVGECFSLHERMRQISLDVILDVILGVADEDRARLHDALVAMMQHGRSGFTLASTVRRGQSNAGRGTPNRGELFLRRRAYVDDLIYAEIARKRGQPDNAFDDVLSMLLATRFEDGNPLPDQMLRDQVMTLIVVGHETTATALAWAFELLFRNPMALARLRQDLSSGSEQYLEGTVKEVLRLRPILLVAIRHLAAPFQLRQHLLPRGISLVPNIYLAHRRFEAYPQPDVFRPERFLSQAPAPYTWIPFGGGDRRCLGANFAQLEMKVAIRRVLELTDLRPAHPDPEPAQRSTFTIAPARGALAIANEVSR